MNEENQRVGSAQIVLRTVIKHESCLHCGATDCELFVTGIENETIHGDLKDKWFPANKLLTAERLCRKCTSLFIGRIMSECQALWKRITDKDYTVESEKLYEELRRESTLAEKEAIVQNAVKEAVKPSKYECTAQEETIKYSDAGIEEKDVNYESSEEIREDDGFDTGVTSGFYNIDGIADYEDDVFEQGYENCESDDDYGEEEPFFADDNEAQFEFTEQDEPEFEVNPEYEANVVD